MINFSVSGVLSKSLLRTPSKWLARSLLICSALAVTAGMSQAQSLRNPRVELDTSMGKITIELYPKAAPKTVDNFLKYVADKHYDGTIFHRVMDGFMIQGGGFKTDMTEKKTRAPVEHEGRKALAAGLKNKTGFVAMARTNDPQSASAQFYINVVDNAFLDPILIPDGDPIKEFKLGNQVYKNVSRADVLSNPQLWGYTVFGKVVSGMDVVTKIKSVKTADKAGHQNVPVSPITINKVSLIK